MWCFGSVGGDAMTGIIKRAISAALQKPFWESIRVAMVRLISKSGFGLWLHVAMAALISIALIIAAPAATVQSYITGLCLFAVLTAAGLIVSGFHVRQITASEVEATALTLQNSRFKKALDNMGEGLCWFGADKRLVVCNDFYARLYHLPPELLEVGTPHEAIIAHRVSHGILKGETTGGAVHQKILALAQLPGNTSSSRIDELADGRLICVTRQPLSEGGWVATHKDVTDQCRTEAKLAHMARHDALTNLPNRVLLSERLENALVHTKRGEVVAFHMIDLDHFKQINDTLGHSAGDKLLQIVADRLRSIVRETDTIARMGGDEFAVVQVGLANGSDSGSLAERIVAALGEVYDIDGHQVVSGTSIGTAVAPSDGATPEDLIKNADLALYRAKADGRSTFRFFESKMDEQVQARRALEQDLRRAITVGEFELHYQPIINLDNDQISGFEALIRWRHPEKGLVPPGKFIAVAEETGLIVPIGEWAIRHACATAAQWPDNMSIAVNLSPVQFRSPGLLQIVVSALAASGLAADRLELEITETVLLQDSEATLEVLRRLRELGVRIAMDDFGTGYSSLSYLQRFPFDKIKIDRSFVSNIAENGSLNIVRAVAALARGLGVAATAEGVETKAQLDMIKLVGCTEMQGFLLSKPIPAHEISGFFQVRNVSWEERTQDAA
jgi:diguanylate cyclase (GGDEF)-like protein